MQDVFPQNKSFEAIVYCSLPLYWGHMAGWVMKSPCMLYVTSRPSRLLQRLHHPTYQVQLTAAQRVPVRADKVQQVLPALVAVVRQQQAPIAHVKRQHVCQNCWRRQLEHHAMHRQLLPILQNKYQVRLVSAQRWSDLSLFAFALCLVKSSSVCWVSPMLLQHPLSKPNYDDCGFMSSHQRSA